MRNFFVNLTNASNNRETSALIPGKSNLHPLTRYIVFRFSVTEKNSVNQTNDHPSPSYATDASASSTAKKDSSPPSDSSVFIKHFVFSPGCQIRIDYRGKLRNEELFTSRPFLNLLIGLAQLSKVDIHLKRISYKRGLKGYDKLLTFLLEEWLNDIRPVDVITAIGPLSPISQIAGGIRDLFYLPIYQYRRDGRLFHGFVGGISSFTTSTALGLFELSGQVVRGAHIAALLCFQLVSPTSKS